MITHNWKFPLPRPHTGALLANGTLGLMLWGEGNRLRLTFGRADWWDHRGARKWTQAMNYKTIRGLLENYDEGGIRELFSNQPAHPGEPDRASVLPIGRLELELPEELSLDTAELDMRRATIRVYAKNRRGQVLLIGTFDISPDLPVLRLRLAPDMGLPVVSQVPAWEIIEDELRAISFKAPEIYSDGWTQHTPSDASLHLRHRLVAANEWRVAVTLEEDIETVIAGSFSNHLAWWDAYWGKVPVLELSDERWKFLYHYGLYKFAGLTAPQGVAATLQGPWIEDNQMPPWSSDYHFNINVQMCYWPALQAGLWDHLLPLFTMIETWLPSLRENARLFVGVEDGLLLPHSVDDTGNIIGAFWSGTIDHACTAWVGKMMFDYWEFTGDDEFLKRLVYPYLCGAMRVYEVMLEAQSDGTLSLPVSVSPEYGGSDIDAWGRDASFQLAACHWLARAIEKAASVLGEQAPAICGLIRQQLPLATLQDGKGGSEIILWKDQPLAQSHRHHSHLGGLHPFDTIPSDDPIWQDILDRSRRSWIAEGMGEWSGWSMPWAAMLHTRFGNADTPDLLFTIWEKVFTNEGHGTLHDVGFHGFSLMGEANIHSSREEIMQMDAGMATTAAIMDAFLHTRNGVAYLFAGVPTRWKDTSFSGLYIEGGFRLSAVRENGAVTEITITASHGKRLKLADPWSPGTIRILAFEPGETRTLGPDSLESFPTTAECGVESD